MNEIKCLDHGFVKLRNLAGPTRRQTIPGLENEEGWLRKFDADDTDVANSARMSFDGMDQDRTYTKEMDLNRYLLKNHHGTPFEAIQVWIEIKLPMFVARQFHRHRTQAINEVSGRYVTLPAEWYIPEAVGAAAKDKKQGQAAGLDLDVQEAFKYELQKACSESYETYKRFIAAGVAPEHARMFLHANHYTHYMFSMNLRNLMHFLSLRDHSHAQIEAQVYAQAITQLLEPHLPGLMGLYRELVKG
jgi:thymidylate synthase (FAD)